MDKYVNATHIIDGIDKTLDSMRRKDGSLPDSSDVNALLCCKSMLDLAPGFPAAEFRPENAPPITFRGHVIGMLKSLYFTNVELVIFRDYVGFEMKDGNVLAAELLPEPLKNWEEAYEKTVRDSKKQ